MLNNFTLFFFLMELLDSLTSTSFYNYYFQQNIYVKMIGGKNMLLIYV